MTRPADRLIGCHLSIAGGLSRAVDRALAIGCTAFQVFTRNPRGWAWGPLDEADTTRFRALTAKGPFPVAHMPYLPNLAGPDGENRDKSLETLTAELERCAMLGIRYLVTHLGSHLGHGEDIGRHQIATALKAALDRASVPTLILMENTAGTKNSLGTYPDELARILDAVDGDERIGICIDTAHAFAAGYDWRREPGRLGSELGAAKLLDRVRVLHFNDSAVICDGRADRHAHLGLGHIGYEALAAILRQPEYQSCPVILETPVDEIRDDAGNVAMALELLAGRIPRGDRPDAPAAAPPSKAAKPGKKAPAGKKVSSASSSGRRGARDSGPGRSGPARKR